MSTESISDRREHIRSVGVTAFSALAGVGAALASNAYAAGADDQLALFIVLAVIMIQFPLIQLSGIYDEEELGAKHYLFITFMTFSMWFVTWGILLTTEAAT